MVPPAMMTALHSLSSWAKWTAGFNSRNLTLLSDKGPGHETNAVIFLRTDFFRSPCLFMFAFLLTRPFLCTTTLPSVLLLVRAMKKPSTCIIGDTDNTFSASADTCWCPEGTAQREMYRKDKSKWINNQKNPTLVSLLTDTFQRNKWD